METTTTMTMKFRIDFKGFVIGRHSSGFFAMSYIDRWRFVLFLSLDYLCIWDEFDLMRSAANRK